LLVVEFTVSHLSKRRRVVIARHRDAEFGFLRKMLIELGVLKR